MIRDKDFISHYRSACVETLKSVPPRKGVYLVYIFNHVYVSYSDSSKSIFISISVLISLCCLTSPHDVICFLIPCKNAKEMSQKIFSILQNAISSESATSISPVMLPDSLHVCRPLLDIQLFLKLHLNPKKDEDVLLLSELMLPAQHFCRTTPGIRVCLLCWGTWISRHSGNGLTVGILDLSGCFQP